MSFVCSRDRESGESNRHPRQDLIPSAFAISTVDALDQLLAPLGNRVHSIVHYERFACDVDVFDEYIELVKRVEQTYYLSVKRYTGGAFLRHKIGTELAKRDISSEILDPTRRDAR